VKRTAQKVGESASCRGFKSLARWTIILGFSKKIRFDLESFRCFGFRMPAHVSRRIRGFLLELRVLSELLD